MSYDTTEFKEAVHECKTLKQVINRSCKWLTAAYDDGFEDAEQEYGGYHDNSPPDLTEELGWLRTRIMRSEMDDALKLVDEIQRELSDCNNRVRLW